MGHEPVVAFEVREDGASLSTGEDDGELGRPTHPLNAGDEVEFPIQHLLVEEKQGAEGLILRGGGDALLDGEMAEKGGDLFFAHLRGVALLVEEDEAADPIEIGLLGAKAVVLAAQVPADAIEQSGTRPGGERRWRSGCDHERSEITTTPSQ